MNSSRIAVIAATAAALAWGAKAVAIGLAGGLVLAVVALVAVTLTATRARPTWQRVAAVPASLGGLVVTVVVLAEAVNAVATSDHWAWYELNLWIFAAVLLGLALRLDRRPAARGPMHVPAPAG